MRTLQTIAACIVLVATSVAALGHEFWIRPDSFEARSGGLGRFYLMNGHRFEGQVVYRNEPYVARFELVSPNETREVLGRHGQATNAARYAEAGTTIVVYESREVRSELPPERFAAYLEEQRLDHVARQREALGETGEDGIEVYVRCAKALIGVRDQSDGTASRALADRAVGLPLEIVLAGVEAESDGRSIQVRVLYGGLPLADARLVAVSAQDPDMPKVVRTDREGTATIGLDASGMWMLTTLHMMRTDDREDADWKSYWASITFAIEDESAAEATAG